MPHKENPAEGHNPFGVVGNARQDGDGDAQEPSNTKPNQKPRDNRKFRAQANEDRQKSRSKQKVRRKRARRFVNSTGK